MLQQSLMKKEPDGGTNCWCKYSNQKAVEIALTYIHGIGTTSAKSICAKAGVPENAESLDLSSEELTRLRDIIDQDCLVEVICVAKLR